MIGLSIRVRLDYPSLNPAFLGRVDDMLRRAFEAERNLPELVDLSVDWDDDIDPEGDE